MNKLICQKCGSEISNDFNNTLSFCTNCGANIQNLQAEKTAACVNAPTLVSPNSPNLNAPMNSKTTRNVLGCLGLVFAAILLSGIGLYAYWQSAKKSDESGKIVPTSQTVRFITNEPESFDPHLYSESIIRNTLFDGLAEYNNQNSDLKPSLATSWEKNADATVWTFHLRKDAKWTDGKPITANDFVYSWKRLLNPDENKSYQAFNLYDVKNAELYNTKKAKVEDVGMRAVNDYTLEVVMEKPTPYFDKVIGLTALRPVPQAAIEKFGKDWTKPENIVTSGAFKLVETSPKNQTVVQRNPLFWNNADTKLEKIIFISEEKVPAGSEVPEKTLDRYEKGEIDTIFVTSLPDESLKNRKDYSLKKTAGTEFLHLNTSIKPFSDVRVRRAFSLAINREKLKEKNLSQFPTVSIVPEIKGYENAKNGGYQPDEARRLLSEAGYPQGQNFPAIEFIFNTSERNLRLAEFVQNQWQTELNINVKLVNLEFKVFLSKRAKLEYNGIARGGWFADYDDPYNFLNVLFADKNGFGNSWTDKKFAEMVEKSNLETDEAKRYKLLNEAETYLLGQQPIIPLALTSRGFLCQPYLKNLSPNPMGYINWREVYVDQNVTADKL